MLAMMLNLYCPGFTLADMYLNNKARSGGTFWLPEKALCCRHSLDISDQPLRSFALVRTGRHKQPLYSLFKMVKITAVKLGLDLLVMSSYPGGSYV